MSASPDYYKLFKIPVVRGREFTEHDTAAAPFVTLINEAFAKQFFPNQDPVGQQMIIAMEWGRSSKSLLARSLGGGQHPRRRPRRDTDPLMIVPEAQVTDGMTALNARIVHSVGCAHPWRPAPGCCRSHRTASLG